MRGYEKYRRSQVRSATKVEIVQMLFQEAVKRLGLAVRLREGSSERIAHLHHVREIYLELNAGLDFEAAPEFCAQVHPLYLWCISTLGKAGGGPRANAELRSVLKVTENLAEGWFQVARAPQAQSA